MKKAVVVSGGVQHLVAEGDEIMVNHLLGSKKTIELTPVMIVDGRNSVVDSKKLSAAKVSMKIVDERVQGEKVVALRYKAKKRVNTKRGHRQTLTKVKVEKITV